MPARWDLPSSRDCDAGYTVEQARAEVDTLVRRMAAAAPEAPLLRRGTTVQPLRSGLFFLHRPFVWLIVAAGAAALLVACVNLATLLLARGRSRELDTAVRSALGASSTRLVRAAFIDSTLLCLLGTIVAVLGCAWSFQAMLPFAPASLRGASVSPLDLRLVVLTVLAAFGSTIVAGVIPALRAGRTDLLSALQRGGGASGRMRLRGGATLLAVQSALAVVLVSGAIMTVWSFLGLVLRDPGHDTADLYRATVDHGSGAAGDDSRAPRVRAILDSLHLVPGVAAAAVVNGFVIGEGFVEPGFWQTRGERGGQWGVSADVFETLRSPLLHGRPFTAAEVDQHALVAILNEQAQSGCGRMICQRRPSAARSRRQMACVS